MGGSGDADKMRLANRFPGQADTAPLRGGEIRPAAAFPAVTTNQGTAASLAAAERMLIETAARIRACEQRQVPPHDHDLADKDSLLLAIGNACALAGSDVLRHLEPQVAAWTDVITQPWLKGYKQNPFLRHQWKYYDVAAH